MKAQLVEYGQDSQKVYESLLVEPKHINILANELTRQIVAALSEKPQCAMDLSRSLKQHEQKIYYHLRNLEKAGMVKLVGTEARYGMTAKLYNAVSPVVSVKLVDSNFTVTHAEPVRNPQVVEFLKPFVVNGKLNAVTVFGYPYAHGKYDTEAKGDSHAFDFALLIGSFLTEVVFPNYVYDVDVNEDDLKSNLILFGDAKSNVIIDRLADRLPIAFDEEGHIVSRATGKTYKDPGIGAIVKCANPLNKHKKLLLLCGVRTRGMKTAVMAFTNKLGELARHREEDGAIVIIAKGLDKDGDKVIDSIELVE